MNNICGTEPVAAGTPAGTQITGDCKVFECNGSGALEAHEDNTDLPNDTNECTGDTCLAGEPTFTPVAEGSTCQSGPGSMCDAAGNCVQCLVADDCPGQDTECQTRSCDTGVCGFANAMQGAPVASQTDGDCKKNQCDGSGGVEAVPDDLDVVNDNNDCTSNTCSNGDPQVANEPLNTPCGMSLSCNGAGTCVGCMSPADCGTGGNACLDPVCNAGVCGTSPKSNGSSCNDGDACTQTDTCQAGACTGANPIVCTAQDQCHDVGTCNAATGVCSNPTKANGATCSDGNLCTQTDTCQAGACTGANPIVCTAQDQCHDVGTCNAATGVCSNPTKANGATCSDGNLCTQTDTCQAGACTGANPIVCTAQDQCHDVGTCAPATGVCSNPTKANGATCSDGNLCTQTDTCQAGACTGANPIVCTAQDQCHDVGTCNAATGVCSNPTKANGATCSDGDLCTTGETCQSGSCQAGTPVVCTAQDQCHDVGTCAPATGVCSNPNLPVNTACSQNGGTACDGLGACVVRPAVTGATPAAAAANVYYGTTIAVTFSKAMTTASITGQTAIGACTGSVQLSADDFTTCLSFVSATPTMTGGGTVATFTPAPALSFGRTYKIKVLGTVADSAGVTMGTDFTLATGFTTALDTGSGTSVIISQMYGGGGNSGAPYTHDFIELHNRGTSAVDIGGWSVQFINAAGSGVWGVHAIPASTTLGAGKYFLIQESSNAAVGSPLPSPDLAGGTLPMGATSGKVALVTNSTAISGACPSGAQIIDMVGYGATATCFETAPTAAPSNTTSVIRKNGGCEDNSNNAQDFAVLPPTPRSTASAAALTCAIAKNETGSAAELDFCNLQFPNSLDVQSGTSSPLVYAQAYEAGITDPAGPAASLFAQIGHGPKTVNPENQSGWVWTNATFNVNVGNNDEWQASFTAPAVGSYFYTSRFSFDGVNWTYCDLNGAGSSANLLFDIGQLPTLTVTP